jgi:hypothetical protein
MHKYLGMTIDYSTKGVTPISMVDFVKDIVVAWDKVSDRIEKKYRKSSGQPTAAPLNLFTVDEDSAKLPEKQNAAFHNIVAKALYVPSKLGPT